MSYKLLESTELGMTLESERLNFGEEHDLQDVVVNDSEVVVVDGNEIMPDGVEVADNNVVGVVYNKIVVSNTDGKTFVVDNEKIGWNELWTNDEDGEVLTGSLTQL